MNLHALYCICLCQRLLFSLKYSYLAPDETQCHSNRSESVEREGRMLIKMFISYFAACVPIELFNSLCVLFSKLQVSEAERKSWETRGAALEKSVEESKERIEKLEKYWLDAQALCKTINQRLNEAQSQHDSLQLKYNKTITLLQEHQQRCV